jgi:hypothetical protein
MIRSGTIVAGVLISFRQGESGGYSWIKGYTGFIMKSLNGEAWGRFLFLETRSIFSTTLVA